MSDPLRVAFVVEGPTDLIVLSAVIESLLPDVEIVPQYLQPEASAAFEAPGGATGLGWSGVYRWCRQTANEGSDRSRHERGQAAATLSQTAHRKTRLNQPARVRQWLIPDAMAAPER